MFTKIAKFMSGLSVVFALVAGLLTPGVSHAYTAVAWIDGRAHVHYAATNYSSQKEADVAALEGCRTSARESGHSSETSKCKVVNRQKVPGGGAIVCGNGGCTISTGLDTEQDAIDRAYQRCEEEKYVECQKTGMTSWQDDEGYPKQHPKKVKSAATCGPPPGRTVRSTYQCNNGDCTRTFENGCTVRFQASYCHNPVNGQWEWKPDGC